MNGSHVHLQPEQVAALGSFSHSVVTPEITPEGESRAKDRQIRELGCTRAGFCGCGGGEPAAGAAERAIARRRLEEIGVFKIKGFTCKSQMRSQ